jgi:hypothetical protein
MSYVERRRFLWMLLLIGLGILAISALMANATTLMPLRFEELVQESTAVARLRCLGSESRWERGEIWTETRFEVVELDKGLLPGLVTVRLVGGSYGHLHSRVDGVPVFRAGEEVYLFLWRRQGEPYSILGWSQGTFRIARHGETGVETLTQDSALAAIFDPRTRAFRRGGIRNLPVGLFRAKLWKALAEERN